MVRADYVVRRRQIPPFLRDSATFCTAFNNGSADVDLFKCSTIVIRDSFRSGKIPMTGGSKNNWALICGDTDHDDVRLIINIHYAITIHIGADDDFDLNFVYGDVYHVKQPQVPHWQVSELDWEKCVMSFEMTQVSGEESGFLKSTWIPFDKIHSKCFVVHQHRKPPATIHGEKTTIEEKLAYLDEFVGRTWERPDASMYANDIANESAELQLSDGTWPCSV